MVEKNSVIKLIEWNSLPVKSLWTRRQRGRGRGNNASVGCPRARWLAVMDSSNSIIAHEVNDKSSALQMNKTDASVSDNV